MESKSSFIKPADRIASFKPYFFATLSSKFAQLKSKGVDIIRVDMGSPDLPPADFIIEALAKSAHRSDTHGYTPNGGTPAFRQAVAEYYHRRFNVTLDPMKETLALVGSKEGLFNLCQVLLNPGDIALIPDPGYPVYTAGPVIAGASLFLLPLWKENHFLPDLDSIPADVLQKSKLLWLNYPNNPTGAVAPMEFFQKAVDFARRNHLVLAHDAPYTDVCFNGYKAPSILQIPGAMDVCVEFNSLSKTYNMAGWRLGMVVGNRQVIEFLSTYKSQVDTSHFQPVFEAGIAALLGDQSWLEQRNNIYQERRDIVLASLRQAGFEVDTPPASIYVWAHLPAGMNDSTAFCSALLEETGVSITPGVVYGKYGEGFIRISLGTSTERIHEAMDRLTNWIKNKK